MQFGLHAPFDPAEWWQLWSCHLTHWNGRHLLLNAIAAVPPLVVVPRRRIVQWLWRAALFAPLISVALLLSGFRGEYRGASGLVVSLWMFGACALLQEGRLQSALLLLVPLVLKLVAEAIGIWPAASDAFTTVATIHYAGLAAGLLAAMTLHSGQYAARTALGWRGSSR